MKYYLLTLFAVLGTMMMFIGFFFLFYGKYVPFVACLISSIFLIIFGCVHNNQDQGGM